MEEPVVIDAGVDDGIVEPDFAQLMEMRTRILKAATTSEGYDHVDLYRLINALSTHWFDAHVCDSMILDLACQHGYLDILRYQLTQGVTIEDLHDREALISACYAGHLEIVQLLLTFRDHAGNMLNINDLRFEHNRILFMACAKGNLPLVEFLLAYRDNMGRQLVLEDICDPAPDRGEASITVACHNGHFEVVEYLLTYQDSTGRFLNLENLLTCDVLPRALFSGNLRLINYLLNYHDITGNYYTFEQIFEDKSFTYVCISGNVDAVKLLIKHATNLVKISHECTFETAIKQILLFIGEEISEAWKETCGKGYLNVLEYLVDLGISIENIRASNHYSLRIAHGFARWDVVQYIIIQGQYTREEAVLIIGNKALEMNYPEEPELENLVKVSE